MNRVILIGRLARDPEMRQTASGMTTCNFTVAVDRRRKAEDGTQSADFIRCVAFGKTGETIGRYLSKGRRIGVEGRIQTGSYTNRDGQKVYTTDVIVDNFDFLDSKGSNGGYDNGYGNNSYNDRSYNGGYEDEGGYGNSRGGWNDQPSYGSANRSQSNPFAQSTPNNFGQTPKASRNDTASAPISEDNFFDDDGDIDIAADDLPF